MELYRRTWRLGVVLLYLLAGHRACNAAPHRTLHSEGSNIIAKDSVLKSTDGKVYFSIRECPAACTPAHIEKPISLGLHTSMGEACPLVHSSILGVGI